MKDICGTLEGIVVHERYMLYIRRKVPYIVI